MTNHFSTLGYSVLDEAFLDMPSTEFAPQSLVMEMNWVSNWFMRLIKLSSSPETDTKNAVYITDRSPFSAVCYSKNNTGHLLDPLIRASAKEVRDVAGIEIFSCLVSVDKETLWGRIQERLKVEPFRVGYDEHLRSHMEGILTFYEGFDWDFRVDNSGVWDLDGSVRKVLAGVEERSDKFRKINKGRGGSTSSSSFSTCPSGSEAEVEAVSRLDGKFDDLYVDHDKENFGAGKKFFKPTPGKSKGLTVRKPLEVLFGSPIAPTSSGSAEDGDTMKVGAESHGTSPQSVMQIWHD